ncbi:MAG TPA: hypothetical protein VLT57_15765 [Bryobacteraceae bacterium]|jgi:hypothetical protein|nr:hypothetical protein [Bryobacteraceae bacterium]
MKGAHTRLAVHRDASFDVWRHTLSQIPSVFGRLVYLASLRDQNTGKYEHHGLALVFSEEEANKSLRSSHNAAFAEWIRYNLEQQKADLDLYLSQFFENKTQVIENWLRLAPYRNLVPASVRGTERKLYLADLEALLQLLKNEYGVSDLDRDA